MQRTPEYFFLFKNSILYAYSFECMNIYHVRQMHCKLPRECVITRKRSGGQIRFLIGMKTSKNIDLILIGDKKWRDKSPLSVKCAPHRHKSHGEQRRSIAYFRWVWLVVEICLSPLSIIFRLYWFNFG
jgi:hypothetical protein